MSAVSRQERWAFWGDGNAAMKPSANLDRWPNAFWRCPLDRSNGSSV